MFTVGVQEMVVIFLVALVLFGPKKLPELGRTVGKAIAEFRRARNELQSTFESQMQSLESTVSASELPGAESHAEVSRTERPNA